MGAVVLLAMSAFALLAVAAPARASTALPRWIAGDYWSYNMTLNTGTFGSATGLWRMEVVGMDSLTIGGTTFDAYHLKDNVSVTLTYGSTTSTITEKGDSWYRTSDLAQAKQVVSFNLGGAVSTTTSTNIPPPAYQWPLTAGATWSQTYQVKTFLDYGSLTSTTFVNVTRSVTVQAETSITVPAGTFTVNQVAESGGGNTTTSSWSEKAGNKVAAESTNPYGQPAESMKLNSYKYGAGSGTVGGLFLGLDSVTLYIIIVVAAGVVIAVAAVGMRLRSRKKQQVPPPPPRVQGTLSGPPSQGPGEGPPPKT